MNFPYKQIVGYLDGVPIYHKVGYCDSNETKPTGEAATYIGDGSILTESNTGDVYFYNKLSDAWGYMFTFKEA